MSGFKTKREKVRGRRQRVRAKIKANTKRFRLSLFRSNRHLWAQIIDDGHGNTLLAVSDLEVKAGWKASQKKVATPAFWAEEVGKLLAEKAQAKKISLVVLDRGAYKYHGLIKAFAQGARQGGLKF